MRLCVDMIEFCAREVPLWHPVSISGYHIREAGSTAAQELAFTLADGFAYVEAAHRPRPRRRRLRARGSRSSSTRTSTSSKRSPSTGPPAGSGRASCASATARRSPRSWLMRFHAQTAGVSLTAQQPEVNIVRTRGRGARGGPWRQPVAAHELLRRGARPPDRARREASRCAPSRCIAHETGVASTIDPLGGSYFVEDADRTGWRPRHTSTSTASAGSAASSPRSRRTSSSARSPRRPSGSRASSSAASASSSA